MNQYKVSYYTVASYHEDYVEANSEFEAISKVEKGKSRMSGIKAKKVFNPTADDYYRMRDKFCIAVGVSALLCGAIIVKMIMQIRDSL